MRTKRPVPQATAPERKWGKEEQGLSLTVITVDPGTWACPDCGSRGLIFNCDLFRERKIISVCKACAIEAAGRESAVYVKSNVYLRRKWEKNAPLDCRLPPRKRSYSASEAAALEEGEG